MLVCGDLHNSQTGLDWFSHVAAERRPELVICLGDIVTLKPAGFIRETLATLRQLAPASMVIPGNWDPRESLVEMDIASTDGLVNLHKRTVHHGGYSFAGLAAATAPVRTTPFEMPDDVCRADGFYPGESGATQSAVWLPRPAAAVSAAAARSCSCCGKAAAQAIAGAVRPHP
jgi:Icc-related predicted phosphoesterase